MTFQIRGRHWPIVHSLGECEWRAVVMMMPIRDSLTLYLSTRARGQSYQQRYMEWVGGMDEGMRNLGIHYLWYVNGYFTCRATSGFTSHPKKGVLRTFIALKKPSPRPGLNPRPLGPVESTLTTPPPRRQKEVTPQHKSNTGWGYCIYCTDLSAICIYDFKIHNRINSAECNGLKKEWTLKHGLYVRHFSVCLWVLWSLKEWVMVSFTVWLSGS
jgi:hypothetical protein